MKAGSLSRRLWSQWPALSQRRRHVGTAAWVRPMPAGQARIGLVASTSVRARARPYEKTQYFPELVELLGARHREAFIHTENPVTA